MWSLYLISSHPEVEQQVVEEIREAFAGSDECTTDTFPHLKYTKAAIEEAMRLYPPVPVIARQMDEDTEIDGYMLPKGVRARRAQGVLVGRSLTHSLARVLEDRCHCAPVHHAPSTRRVGQPR